MKQCSKFKKMRGYNCSFIIENGSFIKWVAATGIANLLDTFQGPAKYIIYTQFMAASALLKKALSTEEWMVAATFVKQRIIVP